jgi:uncharacterized cysteine cluster protein YcgN (CxxCxxCC family)
MPVNQTTFWKQKKLHELTEREWESVCDGCGRCCLHKLEDSDTGQLHFTRIACKLLDVDTCRCSNYPDRFSFVPDCISLKHDLYNTLKWLPSSCAYRLLAEGKDLPDWHPLVSGEQVSVETAGISIRHFAVSEESAGDPLAYIIDDL